MSGTTTDPKDPDIERGAPDESPVSMSKKYLVLSDEELAKGYIRPYRATYKHNECGTVTTMGEKIAATYARDPWFYGSTYCVNCSMHYPLSEFVWWENGQDAETMDPHHWPDEITEAVVALMKAYADLADLTEDERITIIGEHAQAGNIVGVALENDAKKIKRYIGKLTKRFP